MKTSDLHITEASLNMPKGEIENFLKQVFNLSLQEYTHMYAFGAKIPVSDGVQLVADAAAKAVDVPYEDE